MFGRKTIQEIAHNTTPGLMVSSSHVGRRRVLCALLLLPLLVPFAVLAQLPTAPGGKAAISASPSGASIASPIIGYFWSQTDGLASIEGVPGAAHVGRARAMSFVPSRVALPPGQGYFWLEAHDGAQSPGTIDGVLAGSDLISFSQNGNAAALYFRAAAKILIVTGLPDSQVVSASFATPQLDCGASAIAIADDATTVLLACNGNLYSAGADRAWRPVMPGDVAAVSFLPGATDALVIMNGDPAVYGVSPNAQNAGLRAQLPSGMNDPISLAVSADGRLALAIDGNGNAAQIDLAASQTTLLKVAQGMRSVLRGRDPSTFLLIPEGAGVPWIVEARPGNPSASFAPRIPAALGVSQQ
jgi:hypothetical protein